MLHGVSVNPQTGEWFVRGTGAGLEVVAAAPEPPPVPPLPVDTYPLNPNGYVPIAIEEEQTPVDEFPPDLPPGYRTPRDILACR